MAGHLVSLLLLAFAVSVDGFGAGVTYGLRNIRIPIVSVLIIAFCSGFIIWISMAAGALITTVMPASYAKLAGALLLFAIGCWALLQAWRNSVRGAADASPSSGAVIRQQPWSADNAAAAVSTVWQLELKRLGIVVQILRAPQAADVDRSGVISASEAVLLGFALSLDAFGAGIGAAMVGFAPLSTALLIAAASGLFLRGGMAVGLRFAGWSGRRVLVVLPGLILILMGITRLL